MDAAVLESLGSEVCAAVAKMNQSIFENKAAMKGLFVASRSVGILISMHSININFFLCNLQHVRFPFDCITFLLDWRYSSCNYILGRDSLYYLTF